MKTILMLVLALMTMIASSAKAVSHYSGVDAYNYVQSLEIEGTYKGETVINGWYKKGECEATIVLKDNTIKVVMTDYSSKVKGSKKLDDAKMEMLITEDSDIQETRLNLFSIGGILYQQDLSSDSHIVPMKQITFDADEGGNLANISIDEFSYNTRWNNVKRGSTKYSADCRNLEPVDSVKEN